MLIRREKAPVKMADELLAKWQVLKRMLGQHAKNKGVFLLLPQSTASLLPEPPVRAGDDNLADSRCAVQSRCWADRVLRQGAR